MVRLRLAVLLGIIIAGCAAYWQAHTEGTSGPIAWYITDARSESNPVAERYTYAFVLVLQGMRSRTFIALLREILWTGSLDEHKEDQQHKFKPVPYHTLSLR